MSDFWSSVREALRGSRQDFTEVPIRRAILLLAVPMILEMSMESLFAIVDIFWVSRLGAEAVATVGLTEAMLTLIYTVAMGLSIGATATVARRIGEKDPERAARSAVQVILLGFVLAIPIGVAGAILAPQLLRLMGATTEVIQRGHSYTAVMLGGNATVLLLFLGNAVFRGAGDAAVAMRVLWLANGLNILLGPCFIFGLGPFPELGVKGAAVATNIGRGTGALAGYTIAIRIIIFALLPSWGLSNAAATLVGQNLGAGKPERAEQAVWRAGFYNMMFLGVIGTAFVLL